MTSLILSLTGSRTAAVVAVFWPSGTDDDWLQGQPKECAIN